MAEGMQISRIQAREILDSRGYPTIEVFLALADGTTAIAGVPAGASTGRHEAVERRDGDVGRYQGRGVLKAVDNVVEVIAPALMGMRADDQRGIDSALLMLDGTSTKENLGANAILGVSLACARAAARSGGVELYQYLGGAQARILPMPMFNVLNGGKHARNGSDIQEFKLIPVGAETFREALRFGAEAYHALHDILCEGGASALVGDEGGFAPSLTTNSAYLDLLMQAIERAGYRPGEQIAIGVDAAATTFCNGGTYALQRDGQLLSTCEMIEYWVDWLRRYPIVSLEDPLDEDDWMGFQSITSRVGNRVQIVGDDLFVTNREFLQKGIEMGCCNCILIKPNQVGTVTETMDAVRAAQAASYACMVSHRSGETQDTSIADLAVALNCGQLKAGAPARGERVAKYNRLLQIEDKLGSRGVFAGRLAVPKREHPFAFVS